MKVENSALPDIDEETDVLATSINGNVSICFEWPVIKAKKLTFGHAGCIHPTCFACNKLLENRRYHHRTNRYWDQ